MAAAGCIEDLTQETMLRLIPYIIGCRAETDRQFLAWVLAIARTRIVEQIRNDRLVIDGSLDPNEAAAKKAAPTSSGRSHLSDSEIMITRLLHVLVLLLLSVPVQGASQQDPRATTEWPSVERILHQFEEAYRDNVRPQTAGLTQIMVFPDSFLPARVDSLLDGLERFAISSEHRRVQIMAFVRLSGGGMATSRRPLPGIAARLVRIHENASTPHIRDEAVTRLGLQAEREVAVAALQRIAVGDSAQQRSPQAAFRAVWALTGIGPEGEAVLRRLHARGLVREPTARHSMREIAIRRGWERRPGDEGS